tara:strand:+ start:672 stop:1070 length:399 start_codon:yes stop_codon:yes gene_type:complete
MKVEHIGIAVSDLSTANEIYSNILGVSPYKNEMVDTEGVITSFFKSDTVKIELLQGVTKDNAISKFIEKRGEGLHHIAFEVKNIIEEINRLKNLGFKIINETPKKGADNKLICFVHPKDANHVLIELCQTIK